MPRQRSDSGADAMNLDLSKIDAPERILMMYVPRDPRELTYQSLEIESNWIYDELARSNLFGKETNFCTFFSYCRTKKVGDVSASSLGINSISKEDIARFLHMLLVDKFDIPFIAMYRKEECPSLLKHIGENLNKKNNEPLKWHKVLWAIQDLSRKWQLLQKRKQLLKYTINQLLKYTIDHHLPKLNYSTMRALDDATSEIEVDDLETNYNLFLWGMCECHRQNEMLGTGKLFYTKCKKARRLYNVARIFFYQSEEFVSPHHTMKLNFEFVDSESTPEEMASKFTGAGFDTPQAVLVGARQMAAYAMSCDPCIRNYVRRNYMDVLELSTSNKTPDGNIAIDTNIQRKPLHRFENAQWLLVQKAEEDNLIDVTFKLPDDRLNKLLSDFHKVYGDGGSKSQQLWDEQRKLTSEYAIFSFILPSMEKEARSLLTRRAKNWLVMQYGKVLWNKISMAPAQHKRDHYLQKCVSSNGEAVAAPIVMACCWDEAETSFVILDSYGEFVDALCIDSFTSGSFDFIKNRFNDDVTQVRFQRQEKNRIRKFMITHQPGVAVIGAANMSCYLIRILLREAIDDLDHWNLSLCDLRIIFENESLARLYENSQISSHQLPSQSGNVKRAVALGRYVQNPLAMVAALCGPERDILSWKLLNSPFEDLLAPDEKYAMIEQIMVDVTNQVNFDINLAISHEWLFAPLQFISGLGPRKAAHLQQSLLRSECTLSSRRELVTLHQLGEKVYDNAVGFLQVLAGSGSVNQAVVDPFGSTRIHPESYILAQELLKHVYDDKDAVECIKDQHDCLTELDIEAYAKGKNLEDKMQTLCDIGIELLQCVGDRRKPFEELSVDERFYLLTGLTDDTLCSLLKGKYLRVTVHSLSNSFAAFYLPHRLVGVLEREDFSDGGRHTSDLKKKLKEGDTITCMIKAINKKSFMYTGTCKADS